MAPCLSEETRRVILRCRCADCQRPYAEVQHDNRVLVYSRHHGVTHVNELPSLEELAALRGLKLVPVDSDGPPVLR